MGTGHRLLGCGNGGGLARGGGLPDSFSRAGAAAFLGGEAALAGFFAGVGCFLLEVDGFGLRVVMARRAKAAFDPPY
jgi:hypothetical protein